MPLRNNVIVTSVHDVLITSGAPILHTNYFPRHRAGQVLPIATDIDQSKISIGVFLDLSKAFDTLNRDILFSKLENYGIRGVALNWIKSYFKNRKQYVQYNNVTSSHLITQCGVPQGSILGPLFFIPYINDLPNASRIVEPLLFADDTSICYSHSDPEVLAAVLNEALQNIGSWMRANKLSVNIDKLKLSEKLDLAEICKRAKLVANLTTKFALSLHACVFEVCNNPIC